MTRTLTAFVNLRKMKDEDGGYECSIGRHYSDLSYCRRRYFPGRASRKRLEGIGVTRYQSMLFAYDTPTPPQEQPTP